MNKKLAITALALCFGLVAFGHHGHNHMLAGDIIRGVSYVLGGAVRPAPVVVASTPVVTTPAVVSTPSVISTVPAPVVTTTTIPSYTYGYYNNVYCPTYGGYYYYNNAWTWGGGIGYRPPPPRWFPPRHGPGFHHGPSFHHGPGPGFHHGGPHHGPHHRR